MKTRTYASWMTPIIVQDGQLWPGMPVLVRTRQKTIGKPKRGTKIRFWVGAQTPEESLNLAAEHIEREENSGAVVQMRVKVKK